jgi:hypothetical protein
MKKITLWLFVLFTSWQISAQVLTEGFDGTTFPPTGWTTAQVSGTGLWDRVTVGTYPTIANHSGAGMTRFNSFDYDSGAQSSLSSSAVDLTAAGNYRVTFWMYRDNGYLTNADKVDVYINTAQNITGATLLGTVNRSINLAPVVAANGWYQYSFVIPNTFNTAVNHIVFNATSAYGNNIFLDDVLVESSCVAVTSPANGAQNVSNSTITWSANLDATGYKIRVGTTTGGFDVANMDDLGNVTSYSITEMEAGTTYYVTVFPYNANGDATGCTESSFTTCDSNAVPYTEEFEGITTGIPSCWGLAGTTTNANYHFTSYATGNIGRGLRFDSYFNANGLTSELTTPVIDASTVTSLRLKFYYKNPTGGNFEVLVSNDGGTTYTSLETNLTGTTAWTIKSYDLTSYINDNIKVKFKGTSNYGNDDAYVYLDGVVFEEIPATAPLCATNVVATPNACGNFANAITWNASAGADGYRINVGTATGLTDVANNVDLGNVLTYSLTGNIATTYYYTIIPYNGFGPATGCSEMSFDTAATGCYCTSVPTSNDDFGITNVQIATTNFPTTDVTYFNHTATAVDLAQGENANVQVTFGTGFAYNTFVSIDFNDDYDFNDVGELVFSGVSTNVNPTTFNASFVMPATATLGQHGMRINTGDANYLTVSNPCYSDEYGVTLDFTVNIVVLSCTPPAGTATIVPDCTSTTSQFSVAVNVTALGNGTPSISDGTTSIPVSAIGVVNVGPFASGSAVTLTLLHGSEASCNIPLGTFTYTCPPANDECATAQVLTPGGVFAENSVIGTNLGATGSNELAPNCASYQGEEVWYSVVVPASGNITIECDTNTGTAITDTGLAVFSGTCGALTQVGCNDNDGNEAFSKVVLTNRTPGEVLLVSVWEYGGDLTGTFKVSAYDASLSSNTFDNANFKAYPNPVKDILNLSYTSEISSVRIINLLGQEVVSANVNTTSTQIDMSQLSAGAYIVNVTVGDTTKTLKVVKQ